MSKNRVVGQARVKIDGDLLETDGETTLEIGGAKREPVMGDYQASSYRESTEPTKLEVNVLYKGRTSLAGYRDIVGATITVEFDTGSTWLMRDAYYAEVASINQQSGKAKLVFMSGPAEEIG